MNRATLTLEEGHAALLRIKADIENGVIELDTLNEANTRFQLIDRILIECLGWPKEQGCFRLEEHGDGDFRDYVLGCPDLAIWEAKRSGIHFDLPANTDKKARLVQSVGSIFLVSESAEAAIRQVQGYCSDSGVEVAVVCNGVQLIAFAALKIGSSWLKGNALCVRTIEEFEENFGLIWQCLSPDGMSEKRLITFLQTGQTKSIPRKLSSKLTNYPSFRYKSDFQATLRSLSELLLQDVVMTEEIKPQFYRECYCETGALSRDALLSQEILEARYAALFSTSENSPNLEPAVGANSKVSLSDQILPEAIARRPIVLLGDVGVGKTSFLEDLIYVRAAEEFNKAVLIYLDLGARGALESNLKHFITEEIQRQLLEKYQVDIYEYSFVRGVYDLEVKRFGNSYKAAIYAENKRKLDEELAAAIDGYVNDKAEHLKRSLAHVAKSRLRQIVIMLDNADQRNVDVQQEAFVIAQEFARNWEALVFIAVRPQTFFQSKRAGALSAYPHKVLTIMPPRPEIVIQKRLIFALKVAEGRVPVSNIARVRASLSKVASFLRALLHSLSSNRELTEILTNITGGNVRAVVEFITHFIGSPNVNAEKIVDLQEGKGNYLIPIHEFSKAALLGDHSHYVSESSLAMNLFDVQSPDRREHFLSPMIVSFLLSPTEQKDREGFVSTGGIVKEMQQWGFIPEQTHKALRRLTNKKLIDTTERITFEEDLFGLIGEMPAAFRATSVGSYHVLRWLADFAYLDAMVFDTPIFDQAVVDSLSRNLGSFDIRDRYERTVAFRNYLTGVWDESGLDPTYFGWTSTVADRQQNFDVVKASLERNREARTQSPWKKSGKIY